MTNRSRAESTDTPAEQFHLAIAATYREWVGGRIDEDTAMEAIGNALTEHREAQEEENNK